MISSHVRVDRNEMHIIWGNDRAMDAYRKAGSGEPLFGTGAILVKAGYTMKKNHHFEDSIEPSQLRRIEYMIKDERRFAGTGGWGYARFPYDPPTGSFSAYGNDADFARECYLCHSRVKSRDYVFTGHINYFSRDDKGGIALVSRAGVTGSFPKWKLHPILNVISFLVLAAGMAIARFLKRKRWWLRAHGAVQAAGILILACGIAVMASVLGPGNRSTIPHAYFGLTAFILLIITLCGGIIAVKVPSLAKIIRPIHRWAGRISIALMLFIIVMAIIRLI
ncbi:MAG: cytochrome P460 family protein [Spirochaetes bacterium]|nr:cytochrome P460 family protein [Spirochaetota bacterium]